ncbi:MAG: protein kinase [Oculatellaceae cyanobacterium Prado106]|nr:protein kinase [Oculatellaceae cyanobacterium Prado106]
MTCCLNPQCQNPLNSDEATTCQNCGSSLKLLRGRYRAVQPLGQGGFGRTYLAVDEDRLKARCVIKQFAPQVQGKSLEKAIQLFNQEAVRLDELGEHPQIPNLLAYFEQGGYLYLVQQFIEGQSLLQQMRQQGVFSERQIREVLSDVLPILRFIHKHQVIHRDITPANILRRQSDDRIVLIDFGVAKQLDSDADVMPGTRIGTEGYSPLEQFRGGKAYPASDLYSLGATCLHLMTQTRPDNLYDPLNGRWIWREFLQKEKGVLVSDQLSHILDGMLKDLVNERYQSSDEVMRDLNADSFLPASAAAQPPLVTNAPNPSVPPQVATPSRPPIPQPQVSRPPSPLPVGTPLGTPSGTPAGKPQVPPVQAVKPSAPPIPASPSPGGAAPAAPPAQRQPLEMALPRTPHGHSSGQASANSQCLHTLMKHSSWITGVTVSPNGQTFASSSLDDTVKIWHLPSGDELLTLRGHTRGVNAIAISPDGRTLVSGSDDYTLKFWSYHTGALLGTLTGHSRDVNAVAITPDGKFLCSGGEDRAIRLWHMGTGALLKTLSGVAGMIKTIAASPDGKMLASGGLDNKVKLWNLQTGELIQTLVGHLGCINTMAFMPGNQVLATGSKDKTIKLWNVKTGELIGSLNDHSREVHAIAITPNGKTLISGGGDATIKLWDLSTHKVTQTWIEHADAVNAIAISPDGKRLVSGSSDKTVKIWQLA